MNKKKKKKKAYQQGLKSNGSIFDCCIAPRGGRRALSRVLMMTLEGVPPIVYNNRGDGEHKLSQDKFLVNEKL